MKQVGLCLMALWLWAGAAPGGSYDSFAAGVTANVRDQYDDAIENFGVALGAPDLPASYRPSAYRGRALAYLKTQRCKEALADLASAAALNPPAIEDVILSAKSKLCLKDIPGALKDFETITSSAPDAEFYWKFGVYLWMEGAFDEANKHFFASAGQLKRNFKHPSAGYIVLWYAITADRLHTLDLAKLDDLTGTIDVLTHGNWPAPILDIYLKKNYAEKIYSRLGDKDAPEYAGKKCEADFYLSQWNLMHVGEDAAKKTLASALKQCPHTYLEYEAAVSEAERLSLPLPKGDE